MQLGEILVARGLVSVEDVAAAQERQRRKGGRLGDVLVDLHLLSASELEAVTASITEQTPPLRAILPKPAYRRRCCWA